MGAFSSRSAALLVVCFTALPVPAYATTPAEDHDDDWDEPEVETNSIDDVPILDAPRAGDQLPKPVLASEPESSPPALDIGVQAGVIQRTAADSSNSYSPSGFWGVYARAYLVPWLSARLLLADTKHAVRSSLERDLHPDLDILSLGARVEPTWSVHENLRMFLAFGANWQRLETDRFLTASGTHVPRRTGVMLSYSVELGTSWQVWPRHLAFSWLCSIGTIGHESGAVFDPAQVFLADGTRENLPGLSRFSTEALGLLGIGVIL